MSSKQSSDNSHSEDHIITLNGMYQDYFLDYASYVILERAVPAVSDGLNVQQQNLSSALSTIRDADVAEESASYVQSQILQSASATLLVQANSAPQIALTLIQK